jgi:hypothetical protein
MKAAERTLFDLLPRLALAALLLYSSYTHLKNPYYFLGSVYAYGLAGESLGMVVAAVLPFLQLVTGACLLVSACPVAAALSAGLLFSLFVGVQSYALLKKLEIGCGCFGVDFTTKVGAGTIQLALAGCLLAALCGLRGWRAANERRGAT